MQSCPIDGTLFAYNHFLNFVNLRGEKIALGVDMIRHIKCRQK